MSAELKSLQVRQGQLESEVRQLSKTLSEIQAQLNEKRSSLQNITRQIQDLASQKPLVSEHAMLRYAERILKVNLKEIEQKILSEKNLAIINQIRSGKIPSDGCTLIVRNKVVVTVE